MLAVAFGIQQLVIQRLGYTTHKGKIDRKHKKGRLHNSHQKCLRDTLGVWPCMASHWHISVSHDTTEFFLKELAAAYFPSSAGGLSHHTAVKNVICSPTGSKGELSCDLSSLMNNIPLDAYCNANTSSLYLLILSASCRCVGGCISQMEFIQELHIPQCDLWGDAVSQGVSWVLAHLKLFMQSYVQIPLSDVTLHQINATSNPEVSKDGWYSCPSAAQSGEFNKIIRETENYKSPPKGLIQPTEEQLSPGSTFSGSPRPPGGQAHLQGPAGPGDLFLLLFCSEIWPHFESPHSLWVYS